MTTRYRLDIAYDGAGFSGWATQPGLRTVQETLEECVTRVLRLSERPQLVCAGRTDAGVHARGQVAHVDLPVADAAELLAHRLPRALPDDVVVAAVQPAPDGFDARFSALWRRYCYRLSDTAAAPDPLLRGHVVAIRELLDVDVLNEAAAPLLGLRDFAPFCRAREGATTIRTLLELGAQRTASGRVEVLVRADAFCHSMVRSLVGALVAVASGRRDRGWLQEVSGSSTRHSSIPVLPARGLTLEEVGYPDAGELAHRAAEARSVRTLAAPSGSTT